MPTLIKPANGRVTKGFWDANEHPNTGVPSHYAIDIGWYDYAQKHEDKRIFAARSGTLRIQPYHEGYGVNAIIEHDPIGTPESRLGYDPQTFYAHALSFDGALNNQRVIQGQQIGIMGSSGNYTNQTHLHFGFKIRFQPSFAFTWLDPRKYMGTIAGEGTVIPIELEEKVSDMQFYLVQRVADGHPQLNGMKCAMGPGFFQSFGTQSDFDGFARDIHYRPDDILRGYDAAQSGVPAIEFIRLASVFHIPPAALVPGGSYQA